jgi:hypothetical protein
MDEILQDKDFRFAHLVDILVFGRSPKSTTNTSIPLHPNSNLLSPAKCVFRVPEISFLGYKILSLGSQPVPERVADLQACTPPKSVSHL